MTRFAFPLTPGQGQSADTDLTSDSVPVQAIGIRRSDDNKELATVTTDGLLVNLGANNDVTVTSGTVTANHPTTGFGDGRKVVAVAGTRERLVGSTTSAKWVSITAEEDNSGIVVVGGSTVVAALSTRRGIPLRGLDSITLPCDDLYDVYLDATVSGDGVTYTYGTGS